VADWGIEGSGQGQHFMSSVADSSAGEDGVGVIEHVCKPLHLRR
jgi:hypothetical protein